MPLSSQRRKLIRVTSLALVLLATFVFCQNSDTLVPKITTILGSSSAPSVETTLSKADYANGPKRAAEAASRIQARLAAQLAEKNLTLGAPVFIRIFKQSRELELWIESSPAGKFQLFKTYQIAAMSGDLGPKLAEGDRQAPEGFYSVGKSRMNPQSRFHLAFNIGYPNSYDRAHSRTGSAIMVHGNKVSVGCYAMTDYFIEEIYTLCDAALDQGQPYLRVHSFPFHLTDENLAAEKDHKWHSFWKNELKAGYHHFEQNHRPPNVQVTNKHYSFNQE